MSLDHLARLKALEEAERHAVVLTLPYWCRANVIVVKLVVVDK
jgi:hypothetical protein